jgi:hypothetical protein
VFFIFILTYFLFPTLLAIAQSNKPLPIYKGSSSKVSIEQAISVKMTNENSANIHFFTVNFSGSQGEIRRPLAEKKRTENEK